MSTIILPLSKKKFIVQKFLFSRSVLSEPRLHASWLKARTLQRRHVRRLSVRVIMCSLSFVLYVPRHTMFASASTSGQFCLLTNKWNSPSQKILCYGNYSFTFRIGDLPCILSLSLDLLIVTCTEGLLHSKSRCQ